LSPNRLFFDNPLATNGSTVNVPQTLNIRDHVANENVKNFLEYGLSDGFSPLNIFSSAPTYYSDPSEVGGPSGGAFVEQAEELNIGPDLPRRSVGPRSVNHSRD